MLGEGVLVNDKVRRAYILLYAMRLMMLCLRRCIYSGKISSELSTILSVANSRTATINISLPHRNTEPMNVLTQIIVILLTRP